MRLAEIRLQEGVSLSEATGVYTVLQGGQAVIAGSVKSESGGVSDGAGKMSEVCTSSARIRTHAVPIRRASRAVSC
jgi:hypothetical protein